MEMPFLELNKKCQLETVKYSGVYFMKIIHLADVHLGSKIESKLPKEKAEIRKAEVRQAFNKVVNYAVENGIGIILISGDLFDSARPLKKDKDYFYSVVKNNPDIDFIYLRGNHDSSENYTDEEPGNLKKFSEEWKTYFYNDITVSGIEISKQNIAEASCALRLPADKKNVVMLHGSLEELPKLTEKNIDYLALGHIHRFSEAKVDIRGKSVYSGCLEGRGFDEIGVKGFVVLDTDTMKYEFVENSMRIIEEHTVNVSKAADSYEAYKIICDEISFVKENLCLINVCGEITFDGASLAEDIEEYMGEKYFFVYVKNKTTEKVDIKNIVEELSLKGEFVRTVLNNEKYSEEEKERIISVGLKAFKGLGVSK